MEAKKDIGKAFREKLDSLDRQPGDALWDSISSDLDTRKKRKFPLFWFCIVSFSTLAILGLVYLVSNFSTGNNAAGTEHSRPQNGAPSNQSTTGIQNSGNSKNTSTGSSENGVANSKTNAAKRVETTAANAKDIKPANTASTDKVNGNNKKTIISNKAIVGAGTSRKTGAQKNNASTGTGRKNNIAQRYDTASAENSRPSKATNRSKEHSTSSHTSKTNTIVATGNLNAKSGNAGNNKPLSGEKQEGESGATISQTTNAVVSITPVLINNMAGTGNTPPGERLGITNDSLNENVAVVTDTLKTEPPKEVAEKKKDSLDPPVVKRFSIFAYGGPSFFNFPNRTIVTDSTTSNIITKSATRFGVLLGYRLNSKLSIHTGLSVYKLKQSAHTIKLNYIMGGGSATNPELIPSADFDWIDYKQPFGTNSGQIISNLGDNYQAIINIDRELSYLEIPFEIGYNVFDRQFGVDIFGGGSMLLVTKNEVSAYNEKGNMHLGTWNAAATTSFTTTLGLRLHYSFSPSLQLNAEPVLNYNLNTYKDSKPNSFTVRLGLQYNFDISSNKK